MSPSTSQFAFFLGKYLLLLKISKKSSKLSEFVFDLIFDNINY